MADGGSASSAPTSGGAAAGQLYVVATPIGNLADITARAVDVLKSVRVVACEDTRRSRVLLAHIGAAPARLLTLHDHNEARASERALDHLLAGDDVALVSDAGTPLISDPGFELVRLAWRRGIAVTPVPGPSAITAAVAASPIAANRFRFEGFLPAKGAARRAALARLLRSDVPVVFFEAPHRLRAALAQLVDLGGGDRSLLLCRELTKRFETIRWATVAALQAEGEALPRGEFVCILAAWTPAASANSLSDDAQAVLRTLAAELPAAQAAKLAAKITGAPRSELYELAVSQTSVKPSTLVGGESVKQPRALEAGREESPGSTGQGAR